MKKLSDKLSDLKQLGKAKAIKSLAFSQLNGYLKPKAKPGEDVYVLISADSKEPIRIITLEKKGGEIVVSRSIESHQVTDLIVRVLNLVGKTGVEIPSINEEKTNDDECI